jgi:hypothetical protein
MESYPVIPLFSVLFALAGFITYFIVQKIKTILKTFLLIYKISGIYLCFWSCIASLPYLSTKENSRNVFANELQANGIYKFYFAFVHSELDYFKFYKTIPAQHFLS